MTFTDFNSNIILLTDNDIPDGFEFEGHPIFTLRHIQQFIHQLNATATNDDGIASPDTFYNILSQSLPTLSQRLQHWQMNLLHIMAYFPGNVNDDTTTATTTTVTVSTQQEVLSCLLSKCPRATASVDIYGMTPLHHAVINLSQKRISQECHDLLLQHSLDTVVHRGIESGLDWHYLLPIIKAKINALTVEDEESGLVPCMMAAAATVVTDGGDKRHHTYELSHVYELLCMKPDVLKEYDATHKQSCR